MKFFQLNKSWNAQPNAPELKLEIINSDIVMSFLLNSYQYDGFNKNDVGTIVFHNCVQYRLGPPNDEGFYIYGEDRYKQYGIKWGEFYLIKDSGWQENFPNPQIINNIRGFDNVNHYLFYFKDETFECIAQSYDFSVNKQCNQ